jgi:hypothetical protein
MFEVMASKCDQCLLTKNRIVSAARAREIVKVTRQKDCSFICHKGSIAKREIACRGHYDETGGGQLARIARRLNAVVEIDPKTLEPVNNG